MKRNLLITAAALLLAAAGVAAFSTSAIAGPGEGKGKMSEGTKGVQPGDMAPDFSLTDTDGKTVDMASLIKGKKALVVEWFNPGCPFVVKHHEKNTTFADLYAKYSTQDVAFVAINSSAPGKEGHGLELNKKMKEEWKIAYPILMDESGEIGRAYGAKTTPHMFVISTDPKGTHTIVYAGAIDNDRSATKAGDINYVAKALDAVLKGESVETASTTPYGCSVKYGKKN
jgi:peroxiredoxin